MAQITSFDAYDQNEKRKRKANQDVTLDSQEASISWCMAAEFS